MSVFSSFLLCISRGCQGCRGRARMRSVDLDRVAEGPFDCLRVVIGVRYRETRALLSFLLTTTSWRRSARSVLSISFDRSRIALYLNALIPIGTGSAPRARAATRDSRNTRDFLDLFATLFFFFFSVFAAKFDIGARRSRCPPTLLPLR